MNIKDNVVEFIKKAFKQPEQIENSLLEWFDSNKKFAFFTALIVGIITHITFITEMIMSQDGLWNSMCYSVPSAWEFSIGRWGIAIADKLVYNLAIPNITGVIAIIIISISTVLIVDILKLKKKMSIFIVSSAMVVCPALTGTLIYIYTSVAYCLAMLISVLVVKLIFGEKNKILNIILAIILFIFSLGIYQSYIGVVVGLTAIRLIRDLLDEEIKINEFFIHGIIMIIVVIVGGLLYSKVTSIVLDKMQLYTSEYKGLENISIKNSLENLPTSIQRTFYDFKSFYFSDDIVINKVYSRDILYKILFISTFILEGILIIFSKIWKKPLNLICIILMNLILPLALNCILLLATDTITYLLTSAQLILMIPFAIMICEIAGDKFTCIIKWIILVSSFLVVFTYYISDNASYINLKLIYNQTYATTIRIMDRLEQTEGYTSERLVMINGIIEEGKDYRYFKTSNIGDYTLGVLFRDCPVFHGSYDGMEGTWIKYLGTYMGMKIQLCSREDYKNIVNTEEYKEMGVFPEENSIKLINNIMVVKLREEAIMP